MLFRAILAGSWLNAVCFTLQVTQAVRYCYQYFRTDRAIIHAAILSTFIFNIAITALVFASIYLVGLAFGAESRLIHLSHVVQYTVTHGGNIPFLLHINWPIPTW